MTAGTAEAATLAGRAAAEALMVDQCTITRASTAEPVFNEETGGYAPGAPTTVYEGPCRVKPRDNVDRVVQAGEQPISLWPYLVSVPMSTLDVQLDDRITITLAALDPALLGLALRVRQVLKGSHITARRLGCESNEG